MIQEIEKIKFHKSILNWYKKNKRDLPWRKTKDPYKIWVSEIILQQTRIDQGISYYKNFITKFPDIKSLAQSNEKKVLKNWEGLGYYSRAMNMLYSAKKIVNEKKEMPSTFKEIIKLKGVGEYTAAAISSICFDEKKAVLDGNVFRVLSRMFNIETPINTSIGKKRFLDLANQLTPNKNIGDYNQGLMDFGSTQCTKHLPKCAICIFQTSCLSFKLKTIQNRPVKKKRTSKKKYRILNYFMITDQSNNIYFQKRTEDIWNNLYELPLFESKKIINEQYILNKNIVQKKFSKIELKNIYLSKQISHNLSHQKLEILFWKVNADNICVKKNDKIKKTLKTEIHNYPFPQPIKIFLHESSS